jgi:hypothetical protein
LEFGNLDVELIGGYSCIVHNCLIVDYFQYLLRCLFSGKMVFDHFPVFALKLGLEKCPEIDQKFCLEKIRFFVFLCFCVFCGHFGLGKFSGKIRGKNGKIWNFNFRLLFSGKMAPENIDVGEGNLVVIVGSVFGGFYMARKICACTLVG